MPGSARSGAIDEETKRGRVDLLRVYDAAYVKKLEEERGPFTVSDHATLSVAAERWTLDEVLAEMRVPREAVIRIERVWLGRTANDAGLAREVRRAVTATRAG